MEVRQILHRFLVGTLILAFLVPDVRVYAQGVLQLPTQGTLLALSPVYAPPLLKGIKVYRNDPFRFDFILDTGDATMSDPQLKTDSNRLIKYFLASLTVPEKDLWVNLSPYEKDRIVPDAFGQTEMGRDLLAQDYILKQITASVIYPEGEVGKEFWGKVYAEALKRYGSTDIPVDTFNKVWIIPEKATVYENKDSAFVVESKLKVMLEEDYLALEKNTTVKEQTTPATNKLGSDIVREVVIPILEKEVNEGKNFAPLRQVYYSLILATWYKRKVKESILGRAYVDKQKTAGIDISDKNEKEKIWQQYVEAFKKGAYNLIKEEYDPPTKTTIPRKYFSGGTDLAMNVFKVTTSTLPSVTANNMRTIEMVVSPLIKYKQAVQGEEDAFAITDAAMTQISKIFLTSDELVKSEGELMKEADREIRLFKWEFSLPALERMVRTYAKLLCRYDISVERSRFRNHLYDLHSEATNRVPESIDSDLVWQRAVERRRKDAMTVPRDSQEFKTTAIKWIKERFGQEVGVADIKLSADSKIVNHKSTPFGVVYYVTGGLSYQVLYHELLHRISGGFATQWLNEGMTEKLTRDLYNELGEEALGEPSEGRYPDERRLLEKVANVIGWEPLIVSYLTGDESFVIEALGQNGKEAFELLEFADYFSGLKDDLVDVILRKLDAKEELIALEKFLREQENFVNGEFPDIRRKDEAKEIFLERVTGRFSSLSGAVINRSGYQLSPATHSRLVQLSQDKSNPTLSKAAQGMLAKLEQKSSIPIKNEVLDSQQSAVSGVPAMLNKNGGIDLNPDKIDLKTQNNGEEIKINLDPAMLQRIQNASGVTPVIINIFPLDSLQRFLGMSQPTAQPVGG